MKRLLMISPFFVPMNYVGAKRTLHFCRHLPARGWAPVVVALPADIERDPALDALVPAIPLFRGYRGGPVAWAEDLARPLERKRPAAAPGAPPAPRRAQPDGLLAALSSASDRYSRYLPWSYAGTLAFALRHRIDVVYVSAGPYSGLELGLAVARTLGKPLVVDLRDPWSIEENYKSERTPRGQALVEARERAVFERSSAIILNTESALAAYQKTYAGCALPERMHAIRNAFDPALYGPPAHPGPRSADRPLRLGYYGHLRPNKDSALFFEGLARFLEVEGLGPRAVEIQSFGERTPADEAAAARFGLSDVFVAHPWVPFTECPAVLGRCDVLLDLMGPRHGLQISGKLYDYFACGRPILSVSPNLEVGRILEETGAGLRVDNDAGAIAAALSRFHAGAFDAPIAPERLAAYDAETATHRLASLLDRALD